MAKTRRLPAAYTEPETATHTPANDDEAGHHVSLHYAEPSPTFLFLRRWWRRTVFLLQAGVVVALVAAYPVTTVRSHLVDDSAVILSATENWAIPETGIAITKIARELHGRGVAADKAEWHPQARLTAMPAWQSATSTALGENIAVLAALVPGKTQADADLAAAARLLAPAPGEKMAPRLTAAAEALNRYDSRVGRGLVAMPSRSDALEQEARLYARWAAADKVALKQRIDAGPGNGRFAFSKADIETFYAVKARAHVAAEMLTALETSEPRISLFPSVEASLARARAAWRKAADQHPLFVSNGAGNSLLAPNHLTDMAWYVGEAETATIALVAALVQLPESGFETTAALTTETASAAP